MKDLGKFFKLWGGGILCKFSQSFKSLCWGIFYEDEHSLLRRNRILATPLQNINLLFPVSHPHLLLHLPPLESAKNNQCTRIGEQINGCTSICTRNEERDCGKIRERGEKYRENAASAAYAVSPASILSQNEKNFYMYSCIFLQRYNRMRFLFILEGMHYFK